MPRIQICVLLNEADVHCIEECLEDFSQLIHDSIVAKNQDVTSRDIDKAELAQAVKFLLTAKLMTAKAEWSQQQRLLKEVQ